LDQIKSQLTDCLGGCSALGEGGDGPKAGSADAGG
jgi:hypothetical protein